MIQADMDLETLIGDVGLQRMKGLEIIAVYYCKAQDSAGGPPESEAKGFECMRGVGHRAEWH